jgi:hypothetical protein
MWNMLVEYQRSEDWQLDDLWNWPLTSVDANSFMWRMKGIWWNMKMIEAFRFYLSTACIILLNEWTAHKWMATSADGSLLWSVLGLLRTIFSCIRYVVESRDSTVSIATGYGLDDQQVGVRVPVGARIFISPWPPDRLWGLPSLLYRGYRELFPRG